MERDSQRLFSYRQRNYIYNKCDGRCAACGIELGDDWEADHIVPHSSGGLTQISNGQALCIACHKKKTRNDLMTHKLVVPTHTQTGLELREWQTEALKCFADKVDRYSPNRNSFISEKVFVLEAVMGAGKTFFQGAVSRMLLDAGIVDHVVVVVPSYNLKESVANSFSKQFGINLWYEQLDPRASKKAQCDGQVLTYQVLRSDAEVQVVLDNWATEGKKYLLLADEVHHGSAEEGRSWGEALSRLTDYAEMAVFLSGTLWRTDGHMIPGARYQVTDSEQREGCVDADYSYSLKRAMYDSVVNPVFFQSRAGEVTLIDSETEEEQKHYINRGQVDEYGESLISGLAYEKLLSADHDWSERLFLEAHNELEDKRDFHFEHTDGSLPPPAGLCVCMTQEHAKEVASMIERLTGVYPAIVLSNDSAAAAQTIRSFDEDVTPWIVAVKMISEGTDIPRIKVVCYMSKEKTELRFHQIVGRAMRLRISPKTGQALSEEAFVLVPEDPSLYNFVMRFSEASGINAKLDRPAPPTPPGPRGPGIGPVFRPDKYIKTTETTWSVDVFNGVEGVNRQLPKLIRSIFPDATAEEVSRLVNEGFEIKARS